MALEDISKITLKVTDLKQYVYCPRILYFTYVLPVPHPVTRKMEFGKMEHLELDRLEKRRKLNDMVWNRESGSSILSYILND